MKLHNLCIGAAAVSLAALSCSVAQAAVVAGPTVDGLTTFVDTDTGRDWLRLDNFFGESAASMITTATAAGFILATNADVTQMTGDVPLDGTSATWTAYAAVMGSAPNRELMWGAYAGTVPGYVGWGYAYNPAPWYIMDNSDTVDDIPNGGTPYADLNLWAYSGGGVPEPAAWTFLLLGVGGIGAISRSRGRTVAAA
jgi:hypothetical protein